MGTGKFCGDLIMGTGLGWYKYKICRNVAGRNTSREWIGTGTVSLPKLKLDVCLDARVLMSAFPLILSVC